MGSSAFFTAVFIAANINLCVYQGLLLKKVTTTEH